MPVWLLGLMLLGEPGKAPANTISLYRGAALSGQPIRYWDVADTVLDSTKPEGNFGGESYLSSAPGKTILIRFGDLKRALGPRARITKASLLLTISGGNAAPLSQAAEVLAPWGEGPTQVVSYAAAPPSVAAPTFSATWKNRRAGDGAIPWQQPGASGVGDVKPLADVRATNPDPDHVRIEGLAAAIQRQYDRPYDFHGMALGFSSLIEFTSSQARTGRPTLEIEYETLPPARASDLAVVRISRTPEYPRYNDAAQPAKVMQDGAEVFLPSMPENFKAKHWPDNGEEVTYTAVIKNLGDAPSAGYVARWHLREKAGSSVESDKTLAPGEEATVTFRSPFRKNDSDHRTQPIGLEIEPKLGDADPSNNALTIQENALSLGLKLSPEVASAIAARGLLGETTPEGFSQAIVRLWNETIFPQSRFSYAPDGALERIRLQKLEIGSGQADDLMQDINLSIQTPAELADPTTYLWMIGRQLGLVNQSLTSFPADAKKVTIGSLVLERGSSDLYPGIMGGGDTRNESFVPPLFALPYEPASNPVLDVLPIESTDLLSGLDVAWLNGSLGFRRGLAPEVLYHLPSTLLLKFVDQAGNPVKNATVEVYPMANGAIRGTQPVVTLQTGDTGSALYPNRAVEVPTGYKTPLGAELRPNPFGALDPWGANGMLLLRVNAAGNTDHVYLKAWQIANAYRRNPSPAPVFEIRVNVGGDVDRTQSLTRNRIVTDSANQLPAKLAALIDGNLATAAEFSAGKDAWIEIDLGRDRAFGEVDLITKSPFWEQFAIMAYATGQTAADAKPMVREISFGWNFANRSNLEGEGARSVSYRTSGIRARYLRIVRLSDGPPGSLVEVRVHALRAP